MSDHEAEKESVTPRDAPGPAPGPGPDRGDVVGEKGHAIEDRVSDEAAAGTGSQDDQEAGIKETEAESTQEAKRMERRRRAMLNLTIRRAERETRALKNGLVKSAGAEREASNGDALKAAAAQTATRTNAKNEGRARAPKPESEQKTNHAAPRKIIRMRKRTRAPVTVTDTACDHLHILSTPHPVLRTTDPPLPCVHFQYENEVRAQSGG